MADKKINGFFGFLLTLSLLFALFSCENRDLYYGGEEDQSVQIKLHWGEETSIPGSMRIHLFEIKGERTAYYQAVDINSASDNKIKLPVPSTYKVLCYDYFDSENILFRNEEDPELIEASCVPEVRVGTRVYSSTEATVSNPDRLFVSRIDRFDVIPSDSDLVMDFYPKNVLYTYTFRITGVIGVKNIEVSRGGISGMSASYFLATGKLSETPSTILFQVHRDIANNILTGSFQTFGRNIDTNYLSIELYNSDGKEFSKQWDVRQKLIDSEIDGTYHIEIGNAGIEVTPGETPVPNPGSGFVVDVDGWKDQTITPL
jgi:hypothetical protein